MKWCDPHEVRGLRAARYVGALVWALSVIGPTAILSSRAVVEAQAAPRTSDDRVLERALARAARELTRHRTRQALVQLRRAVLRAPTDARAPLLLAETLLPTELPQTADEATIAAAAEVRTALEGATHDAGIDVTTRRQLERLEAWARAVGGDRAGAVDTLATRCGRLDEDAALLLRKLAAELARGERLAEAEAALRHATRCAAQLVAPLSELGAVRLARGHTADAVETFREVVRRLPGDPDALRDLAGALLAEGQAQDGLALYAAVAATCTATARCQLDLARAALEAQEPARAITAAREALRLDPHDPEPALVLAAAQLAARQPAQAADAYREALRRHPDDVRATQGLRALAARAIEGSPDAGTAR